MYLKSVDGKVLYEGRFSNIRQGVEQAVEKKIDLTEINLRCANLAGGSFDAAIMPRACLWGANLTDVDFSGAELEEADFRATTLLNSCLAESNCANSNFEGAYFSKTIVTQADLKGCKFSCPSLFQINLAEAKTLQGSIYSHLGEDECDLSHAPLIINGLMKPMIFMDNHVLIGGDLRLSNMRERLLSSILHEIENEKIAVNQ